MEEIIKSPLNYTGGKYRLLKKGLLNYFPNDINTFIDLFGGSGTISVNVKADKIFYNEIIPYLPKLFNTWKEKSLIEINEYIDNTIEKFNLSGENQQSFIEFRKYYNKNKNIEDLFILICYSFNFQMRFNNKQEYNSSFGKQASTMNPNIRKNLNTFVTKIKEKDIIFLNNDFRELKIDKLSNKDFVYLDPPYILSCGVYQDGKRGFNGWSIDDEKDMFNLLDELNNNGVRFALSNLLESKGNINEYLVERCKKYNIQEINMNYNGSNYQRTNKRDKEIIVTNY